MADIVASFEGPHKEQKTSQSNWLPVRDADIPNPHPAKVMTRFCFARGRKINLKKKLLTVCLVNLNVYHCIYLTSFRQFNPFKQPLDGNVS